MAWTVNSTVFDSFIFLITIANANLVLMIFYINQCYKILFFSILLFSSVQSLSRVWLCDLMNRSTSGLPVHHYLPEFTQTHIHRVGDAIQPSHPLLSPFPPAPNPSQPSSCLVIQWCYLNMSSSATLFSFCLQSFQASGSIPMDWSFPSDGQNIGASGSTSVLPINIPGWFPSGLTGLISLQPKGFSRVFSNTTIQKHQFFGTQLSSQSNSHIHTWPLEKPYCCLSSNHSSRSCQKDLSKLKVGFW